MGMTSYTRGILAGMELAMRICRNRKQDISTWSGRLREPEMDVRQSEVEACAGLIRLVQVEIGAGRQPLPEFTLEEQDEINRIH